MTNANYFRSRDTIAEAVCRFVDMPTVTWATELVRLASEKPTMLRYAPPAAHDAIERAKFRLRLPEEVSSNE